MAAHGVLHDLPGWTGRCEQRGARVGRQFGSAHFGQRADLGRRKSHRAAGDSGFAGGTWARGDFQLQSDAPGYESWGPADAMERDSELAGDYSAEGRDTEGSPTKAALTKFVGGERFAFFGRAGAAASPSSSDRRRQFRIHRL